MNLARIRWIALAAALLVVALGYLSLARTVTIMADGQVTTFVTRAVTVGGALREAGISLGAHDNVEPGTLALLGDGTVIDVQRAARIQLHVDGQTHQTESGERNPAVLLALWNVDLGVGDRLTLGGQTITLGDELPDAPFISLEVRRAVEVTVADGGQNVSFVSSAPTVGQALAEHGVQLAAGDRIEPAAETPLDSAVTISIIRARPITIRIGDENVEAYSAGATVGEALADAGVALQGLDYSEPAADELIPDDGQIDIVRVSESLVLEQVILPHQTEWQEDPNADLDTISIVQEGQDGVSLNRTRTLYANGEESSTIEEAERVVIEPSDQINGYGSRLVLKKAVVDGVEIEYYRAVTAYTTWYSPCNSGTSSCLNGTSSGLPVQRGTIATYLNWYLALKFTNVYIPGYGMATFGDNNGANSNGREFWIDLAFSEAEVAAAGGKPWTNAYVTVYFVTPAPAYIPPVWPP